MLVGQKWLGAEVLGGLLEVGHEVAAVAAPADDRLYAAAVASGIPAADPGGALQGAWVPDGVDLIVAAHAHCFVTKRARNRARHGAIGYHPSLLPRHRGRDAVRWTIHMGDRIAGGTVYWMTDRADAGPIAAQGWCHVMPGDDAATLWRRDLGPLGLRLLLDTVEEVAGGRIVRLPQDEALATWEPSFDRPPLRGGSGG